MPDTVNDSFPNAGEANLTGDRFLLGFNKKKTNAVIVDFEISSDTGVKEITLSMNPDKLSYPKLISFQNLEIPLYNDSRKPHHTILTTWNYNFTKGSSKEMVIDM